ncbi:Aminoglycoside 3'-phosphotransferase [Cytospora mali]|uniref:Aminoglycoside 3'-phosphotransferase n=1 Tax=Cytospora mali TaxID=578113 RepID=A0A194UXI1_CYTMA|nr:Aminoglycoside 3'-phosphotransferase [Valsa mali var. pyri (nom. inval.)]
MSGSTDEELVALRDKLRHLPYLDAVEGNEIYNYFGGLVIEHKTTNGRAVAVKVSDPGGIDRSEAEMMHYAATHGVRAPKVLGHYNIVTTKPKKPLAVAMVSERVPGVSLVNVWLELSKEEQSSIKEQLRMEITRMRKCTQPFIGRVGNQETRNVYDRLVESNCGPFSDEKAFDDWCLARAHRSAFSRWKWGKMLERERRKSSGLFVLTHGDLTPRNIMVKDGVITGIVDWERSGFFPEYAEYAFAMKLCHSHEKWWIPVLEEILQPCSKQRLEFTRLAEDRGCALYEEFVKLTGYKETEYA